MGQENPLAVAAPSQGKNCTKQLRSWKDSRYRKKGEERSELVNKDSLKDQH